MPEKHELRYRLRQGNDIKGYLRKISQTMSFYSPDSFWWSGKKIEYKEVDEWTGLKDKNAKHIYEWDIIKFKLDPDSEYLNGVVLWEAQRKVFGIKDISTDDGPFIPFYVEGLKMFNESQLQVFSYLFLNPELKEKLGVTE